MSLTVSTPAESVDSSPPLQLSLLRGFQLRAHDQPADVPLNVQRLLAFLAVSRTPQHRVKIAGTLWTDSSEQRAAANLRTALWRAKRIEDGLIATRGSYLTLGDHVEIDLDLAVERARQVVMDPLQCDPSRHPELFAIVELLPEWYDDWVLFERERLRQLLLHSLEILCGQLSGSGRHCLAIEAGLAAVAAEPLRESAQRALISAHVQEGNMGEAVRQYDQFAIVLADSLGIEPSESLRVLVAPCR